MYRWFLGDLRTGKIARTIELTDPSATTVFDDADVLSAQYPLKAINEHTGTYRWPTARSDAAPAKAFLAVAWVDEGAGEETFIAGGPVWTHRYTDADGILRLGAAGIESVFDHRKVLPVLAAGQGPADVALTLTGRQLALIAKRLIAVAMSHTGGNLPIALPTDDELGGAGDQVERYWEGYELASLGDALRGLAEQDIGPELQFVPRRRADDPTYLEWVARIGVEPTMMLTQTGRPWLLDRSTPGTPITDVDVSLDGTRLATRVFGAGGGSGDGREIVVAENQRLLDLGYPLLEADTTATDAVIETDTLAAFTAAARDRAARPGEQISIEIETSAFWRIARSCRPGDWCTLRLGPDHPYLPKGDIDLRILDLRYGTSTVTVSCAERAGDL